MIAGKSLAFPSLANALTNLASGYNVGGQPIKVSRKDIEILRT